MTILPVDPRYVDYLRDESRLQGQAESISFPETTAQVQEIVTFLHRTRTPVTVQGSRTGITGGAVPLRGHILNLSNLNRVTGIRMDDRNRFCLQVQPGITLAELNRQVGSKRFDTKGWDQESLETLVRFREQVPLFWPPDPTEDLASIGGMAGTNASGICARKYGRTGAHIRALNLIDPKGDLYSISRGEYVSSKGRLSLPWGAEMATGLQDRDLLDILMGSEGSLGALVELSLVLAPLPREIWAIVFFFTDLTHGAGFVETVRERNQAFWPDALAAVEILDNTSIRAVENFKQVNTGVRSLPCVDPKFQAAVYLEIHAKEEGRVEQMAENLMAAALDSGSDPHASWAFSGETEVRRMRRFRTAVPEALNFLLDQARKKDPGIFKLGTDMALPGIPLTRLISMYRQGLEDAGLAGAIFGHAADNHLHVNILAQSADAYTRGRELIKKWAKEIRARGGNIACEHGIGKIKQILFEARDLPDHTALVKHLKQILDPFGLWNPGNMPEQKS